MFQKFSVADRGSAHVRYFWSLCSIFSNSVVLFSFFSTGPQMRRLTLDGLELLDAIARSGSFSGAGLLC